MSHLRNVLEQIANRIADYRDGLADARVGPMSSRAEVAASLDRDLPDDPTPVEEVIDELADAVGPGLMSSAGPRYFGFVVGGSTDAALAADLLTTGWDQVAFNEATSPAAVAIEDIAGRWLKDLLCIPSTASVGFVTGGQAANTVGLAAARLHVLRQHGWDVGTEGLNGAPSIRVLAGEERHATIDRAVRLLGLGERSIEPVSVRADGAMDAAAVHALLEALPPGPMIVCAQAGNVNTGAFDDLRSIANAAKNVGAWVHVDGAFGLWAAASAGTRHLVDGIELADSWACDGHKWLNVPYDSGFAFCANPDTHATALAYTAAYLTGQVAGRTFGGGDFVPESSRRARGFATWAALRSMGRSGVADLVNRNCALARRFAEGLGALDGIDIVNDVVLNQVLVRVGDEAVTNEVERWIHRDGTAWLGATTWRGERLLRISVSNWSTSEQDVDVTIDAIRRAREHAVASLAVGG
ncbi:MAG TPA: aminotransferase class V-fold PLP-dependent enzyme [Acidimicrobiia bacterium]|nr:aminotransferase class V-fold PLP-dependent enzyme [Acidimicrobiia bacterium]